MNFPGGNNHLSVENLADKKIVDLSGPFANNSLVKDFLWSTFLFVTAQRNLDTLFAGKVAKLALRGGTHLISDNEADIAIYLEQAVSIFKANIERDAKNFSKQFLITAKKHEIMLNKLLSMSKVNSFLIADRTALNFATNRIPHSFNDSDISEYELIKMCDGITLANLDAVDGYAASTIIDFSTNKDDAIELCRLRAINLDNQEISVVSGTEVATFSKADSDDCIVSTVEINFLMTTFMDKTITELVSDLSDNGALFTLSESYNIAQGDNCALVNAITKGDQS